MDYHEIINNLLGVKKYPELPSDLIFNLSQNPLEPKNYILFHIPKGLLFDGHIITLFMMVGLWLLNDVFNYLFWNDIREIRNRIKEFFKR